MKVICIDDKGLTRLVKGKEYEAYELFAPFLYRKGVHANIRHLRLEGLGHYSVYRFKSLDGQDLNTIQLFDEHKDKEPRILKQNVDYSGHYVIARYDSEVLKRGETYLIESHFWPEKVRIKGIKSPQPYFYFKELTTAEKRKLKLQTLNGEKIKTGAEKRKYSEREKSKILFDCLSTVMRRLETTSDLEGVSFIEHMLKAGKNYQIISEDIENFLNKDIKDSIKQYGFTSFV